MSNCNVNVPNYGLSINLSLEQQRRMEFIIENYPHLFSNHVNAEENRANFYEYIRNYEIRREHLENDVQERRYSATIDLDSRHHDNDRRLKERKRRQIKLNTPDKRSWLSLPVGLEYTFHFPTKIQEDEDKQEIFCEIVKDKLTQTDESTVYVDCGVLEIASPVHKTWKETKKYYSKIQKLSKKMSFRPTNRNKGGGGCHLNFSVPKTADKKIDIKHMLNLISDLGNRPYINWIFNEPSDNKTAKSFNHFSKTIHKNVMKKLKMKAHINSSDWAWTELESEFEDRGLAIRIKDEDHFEFRCIDMVRNQRDLKDVLQFFSKYVSYTKNKKRFKHVEIKFNREEEHYEITRLECVREFKKMLKKLNLNYKDYRRFVERNLYKRYKEPYGKYFLK